MFQWAPIYRHLPPCFMMPASFFVEASRLFSSSFGVTGRRGERNYHFCVSFPRVCVCRSGLQPRWLSHLLGYRSYVDTAQWQKWGPVSHPRQKHFLPSFSSPQIDPFPRQMTPRLTFFSSCIEHFFISETHIFASLYAPVWHFSRETKCKSHVSLRHVSWKRGKHFSPQNSRAVESPLKNGGLIHLFSWVLATLLGRRYPRLHVNECFLVVVTGLMLQFLLHILLCVCNGAESSGSLANSRPNYFRSQNKDFTFFR